MLLAAPTIPLKETPEGGMTFLKYWRQKVVIFNTIFSEMVWVIIFVQSLWDPADLYFPLSIGGLGYENYSLINCISCWEVLDLYLINKYFKGCIKLSLIYLKETFSNHLCSLNMYEYYIIWKPDMLYGIRILPY
jgi:hypothetical protein